jgi:hypothetical protein
MMCARPLALALVSLMLCTHASAIPRNEPVRAGLAGQALLCLYRGLDWYSKEEFYAVRIHDEEVGGLARGSFLSHLTTPGRRIIVIEADSNVSRSFELQGGKTYFIRVDRKGFGFLSLPKLLPVTEARGVHEIRKLHYAGSELSAIARQNCLRDETSPSK